MTPLFVALVTLLILGLLFLFQMNRNKPAFGNTSDIYNKYKVFIELALAQGKTSRIERLRTNSLSIKTSNLKNASVFSLTEVENRIIIVWTWSDHSFGRRGKEWSFPDNYDQKKMFDEILEDVLAYQLTTYQKHNQHMPA